MQYYHYISIDSTNNQAKALIAKGVIPPFAVTADTQTHGKGKPGRIWYDKPNQSLLISIVLSIERDLHQYSFIAGVALRRVIKNIFSVDTKLKWVNDLYVKDKKIAGILCEKCDKYIIIGIGLNVLETDLPQNLDFTSITIENPNIIYNYDFTQKSLYDEISALSHYSFNSIMDEWNMNMFGINQYAKIQSANRIIEGVLLRADKEGRLLIKTQSGTEALISGTFIK